MDIDKVKVNFLKDVKDHKMSILRDDGLYRHLKFSRNNSSVYQFHLITWPGHLTITGDMGSNIFSRVSDMFTFFREKDLSINPGYWHEKLEVGKSEACPFSVDMFKYKVECMVRDALELEDAAELPKDLPYDLDEILDASDEWECIEALRNYDSNDVVDLSDWWECRFTDYTYHYIWQCYAIVYGINEYDKIKEQ